MVELGKYNTLEVLRKEAEGYFLAGDKDFGDILLPNSDVVEPLKIGEKIEVFVYIDSDDLVIATLKKPFATVGEFAKLRVSSIESFGVFLNWGLDKELFLPFREKLYDLELGQECIVFIYVDSSFRIAATTRIVKHLDKTASGLTEGTQVEAFLYQNTDLGVKAIVNGQFDGLLYKDDTINSLSVGDVVTATVKKVRSDHKLDLSIAPLVQLDPDQLIEEIVRKMEANGGRLNVTAKTSASRINSLFNVSRKKFKIALGNLYKRKVIEISDTCITLVDQKSKKN